MPLYDFVCNVCGLREERIVQSHITQLKCGSCTTGTLERQAAAPAFEVKGFSARNGYSGGTHDK